jgi:hypothetical protein
MYAVMLNGPKAVIKINAPAGPSGAVKGTSMESTAQDEDFREIKRRRRHTSNNISQTAKKSTKPAPTSAIVKLPPKAVSTRNFFAPQNYRNGHGDYRSRSLPENLVGRDHD